MKVKLFYLFLTLNFANLFGQQFSLLGNAVQLDPVTYRLTPDAIGQRGMMTNYYPLDLTKDFTVSFQLNFGTRNSSGADGFAFILSKVCNPALISGGGLGAEGINNSVIVEFDTYENGYPYDQDPSYDHLGIYKDGLVSRTSGAIMDLNSNQPVRCGTGDNVEDGIWHSVDIKWSYISVATQKIEVYFDGALKQSSTQNHILNRFLGQNLAFWSITAATGSFTNLHQVKVSGANNNYSYSCGQSFQLAAPDLGSNYVWTPTPASNSANVANYIAAGTQTITCKYIDFCGLPKSVDFNISTVATTPTFSFPTNFCQGGPVPVLPTTSNNGLSGTWNPPAINNGSSGNYQFTPNVACGNIVTVPITINPKPVTTSITAN